MGRTFDFRTETATTNVEIVETYRGIQIAYHPEPFPWLGAIKGVMDWFFGELGDARAELGLEDYAFILRLSDVLAFGSINTCCWANVERDTIMLNLGVMRHGSGISVPMDGEPGTEHLIYHELMHAKDVVAGRFPSISTFNPNERPELCVLESLWHFSLEGRLETMSRQYKTREAVLEEEYRAIQTLRRQVPREMLETDLLPHELVRWPMTTALTMDFLTNACDRLWGAEVTFEELEAFLPRSEESD